MSIVSTLAGIGGKLLASFLTEKFLLNLVVLLLDKAAERWGNPLAKELLDLVTDALENPEKAPETRKVAQTKLYEEVKSKRKKLVSK